MSEQEETKTFATIDKLKKKSPVRKEVTIVVDLDSGETEEVTLVFQAISNKEYDKLVSKYPPNAQQKKEGANYDVDKFAPALISACSLEPDISLEDAKEIWDSETWNRGELMNLFWAAVSVNQQGHELPPTESG